MTACSRPSRGTGGEMGSLGPAGGPFMRGSFLLCMPGQEGGTWQESPLPHSDFLSGDIRCWSGSWHAPICWPACVCTSASCVGGRRQTCLLSALAHQPPGPLLLRASPCRAEATVKSQGQGSARVHRDMGHRHAKSKGSQGWGMAQ